MTEAQILVDMGVHGDRVWSIMQFWTSVSFGILIAAHFAAERLNLFVLVVILLLYTSFSLSLARMLQFDQGIIFAGIQQLQLLAQSGSLSLVGQKVLATSPLVSDTSFFVLLRMFMTLGLFITTIVYSIYSFLQAKQQEPEL